MTAFDDHPFAGVDLVLKNKIDFGIEIDVADLCIRRGLDINEVSAELKNNKILNRAIEMILRDVERQFHEKATAARLSA